MTTKKTTKKKTAGEVVAQETKQRQHQEAQKLNKPLEESMHPSKAAPMVKALDKVVHGKPVMPGKPFTFLTDNNERVDFILKADDQIILKPAKGYTGGWLKFEENDVRSLMTIFQEIAQKGESIRS